MDHGNSIKPTGGLAPGFLKSGWFWAVLRWGSLGGMMGMIAVAWGRRGISDIAVPDPLMYTNLGNLAFWVLWLMGLVVLVPIAGRAFCSVCPVGALNEFVSRFGLKKVFPGIMRNQYPKTLVLMMTVLLMGLWRIHHFPDATAIYLLAWLGAAVAAGALFAGRSLCAYLCPVGGMLGLYGRTAPVRVGVREDVVCRECEDRECVRGALSRLRAGFGRLKISWTMKKNPCPVNLKVWEMDGTDRCLMCFNCMRVCPLDNVAVFKRRPFSSLWRESYPRFSDVALLAALTGFILLTFSRFWPPVQALMGLPFQWIGFYAPGFSRPILLLWIGIGLPLLTILVSAAFVVWSRTASTSQVPEPEPGSRRGSPLKVWFEMGSSVGESDPSGEERIMGADTVRGLSAVYAPVMIPFVLSSHMVLALVKINTKLSYLPLAMADPAGVRSYLAIWDLDLLPVPGILLPIGTLKILSIAVLLAGTAVSLVTYSRISRREGTGALPMLFPLVVLGVVVYGGLYNWLF